MPDDLWQRFESKMNEIYDIGRAQAIAGWDREVMMPPKGELLRQQLSGTLAELAHHKLVDPELGDLLEKLSDSDLPEERATMVDRLRWERDREVKIPARLARDMAEATSRAVGVWQRAREADDYSMFEPELTQVFSLKQEQAEALGYETEPYDVHLEAYERGVTAAEVKVTFDEVAKGLSPLLEQVLRVDGSDRVLPEGPYDLQAQQSYCNDLAARLGFDFEGGRLDLSAHPFTTSFGPQDVRITTRVKPEDPLPAVMATIHEVGHGMYEAGFPVEWARTSIGSAPSMALHESQSRLWENQVGRSRAFWEGEAPRFQGVFEPLKSISAEEIYRAATKVERSLIRVDADELTYPMHIIARFDVELALSRGEITAHDLPAAFNESLQRNVSVTPTRDADGVLQDIHWSIGHFGYFPTYLLGTIYSAQIFDALTEDIGGRDKVEDLIRGGEFAPLLEWLRTKVHSRGSLKLGNELMSEITGSSGGVDSTPYLRYMTEKYSDLYGLAG